MKYTATITTATLRLRESRIIADLLLKGVDAEQWREAIIDQNVLQMNSIESILRISRLLRARLEPLKAGLWAMVRDGDRVQATQAILAGAIYNSRLLGDFMDTTLREQRTLFAKRLEPRMWQVYIEECRSRDSNMPQWSDATIARLRSSVFSILAEAGYLKNTQSLILQNVFVDQQLASYLKERNEKHVLRCMEVAQ